MPYQETAMPPTRSYASAQAGEDAKREGSVPLILGELRHQVDELQATIGALLTRLSPVTRDEPQCADKEGPAPIAGSCAVSRELYIIRDKIGELSRRVANQNGLLEL